MIFRFGQRESRLCLSGRQRGGGWDGGWFLFLIVDCLVAGRALVLAAENPTRRKATGGVAARFTVEQLAG
jgi:hypothetical protein